MLEDVPQRLLKNTQKIAERGPDTAKNRERWHTQIAPKSFWRGRFVSLGTKDYRLCHAPKGCFTYGLRNQIGKWHTHHSHFVSYFFSPFSLDPGAAQPCLRAQGGRNCSCIRASCWRILNTPPCCRQILWLATLAGNGQQKLLKS